ncbi:uncharacterized protein LOC111087076 isoform X2 [Limulus polyphemus]|nr:uncharacterized protein LOC111087076 isoform X2 [Limulus polyphemus]
MTNSGKFLILLSLVTIYLQVKSQDDQRPLRLISNTECDRYNLDALYHERYKVITKDILTEMKIFVERMTDRMFLSLQDVLLQLPGRESSDKAEERMYRVFEESKKIFAKKMDKIEDNTTKAWEALLDMNYKFITAQEEGIPELLIEKVAQLEEAYNAARQVLDTQLQAVISPVKVLIINSLNGVEQVLIRKKSEQDSHHHHQHRNHGDDEADSLEENEQHSGTKENVEQEQAESLDGSNSSSSPVTLNDEEEVKVHEDEGDKQDKEEKEDKEEESDIEKKKKIIRDIVPGFLGTVSELITERNVDLTKHQPQDERDSPFDEIVFAIVIMAQRVKGLLQPEDLSSDETFDLARRNLLLTWAQTAKTMYSDKIKKIKENKVPKEPAAEYFQKKWTKDDALAESLLIFLEMFP